MPQARFIGKPRSQTDYEDEDDDEDDEFHRCSSPVALCGGLRRAENRV